MLADWFPVRQRESVSRWAGPLVIALARAFMLVGSWLTWPDVLIDFGRELYVAWRLAEGDVLFTDIAYFNGPLSPYMNALWFRLFEVSLLTLVLCNLAILVGLIIGLYRILSDISDRLAATAACVTFVAVFAFGQLGGIGNFNYICPYSHEMTHGLALSIGAVLCLSAYLRRRRLIFLSGAGFALGLVFLTKAEVFLASAFATTVFLGLTLWVERPPRRRQAALMGTFAGAAAIPPAVAFILLSLAMPADQALRGTLGSWPYVFNNELASLTFYRSGMGTLHPQESLERILLWTALYVAVFLPTAGLGLHLTKPGKHRIGAAAGVFVLVAVAALFGLSGQTVNVFEAAAPLPVVLVALGAATGLALFRHRGEQQLRARLILRMTLSALAFVLLGKILFNVRFDHYGFALAMPATLLAVVTLVGLVPDYISRRGGYGEVFRAAGFAVLLLTVVISLYIVSYRLSYKQYVVSKGADIFFADSRGTFVNTALDEIAKRIRPDQSLAVLPEGVMLNYLSRIASSTPHINFMPPELIIFGEERILDSFRANPPDYIALVHKETPEYGLRFFGRDYGQRIFSWVQDNYLPVTTIGATPLQDRRFGILLLQRARDP